MGSGRLIAAGGGRPRCGFEVISDLREEKEDELGKSWGCRKSGFESWSGGKVSANVDMAEQKSSTTAREERKIRGRGRRESARTANHTRDNRGATKEASEPGGRLLREEERPGTEVRGKRRLGSAEERH